MDQVHKEMVVILGGSYGYGSANPTVQERKAEVKRALEKVFA